MDQRSSGKKTADKQAELKLCSQEARIPGESLKEKVENLQQFGGVGMEFGGDFAGRIPEIKQALTGSGVGVAALCCGYFSLIDPDKAKRQQGAQSLKETLTKAGELGGTGVIVVPAFNHHPQLEGEEGRKVLLDLLPAVGEHAVAAGSRVLLEPLNKAEAHFLNRLEQAADICKALKSPGICLMGDFYHMFKEEKDDEEAFVAADGYLHHVHLASRTRILPGQDDRSFVAGFRGLKKIGYRDYCSLECGIEKDTDPMVEIPKAFEFLRKQWAQATV